ncbi:MAG TPA: LEA type 2 family protein [Spongiibacteraceae bacterium]|nr:LEA type 2 family protein [Spongiibacteraceae bacterium]
MKRIDSSVKLLRYPLSVVVLVLLSACAVMQGKLEAPDVTLVGLRLGQGDGLSQTVLVDLMITNPNRIELKFNAISYRVRIEGRDLVSGTSREPLAVAAGGSQKYTVPATVSLMSGFGLIRNLVSKPKSKVAYELNATLEPSGLFSLPISVKKTDMISLQ